MFKNSTGLALEPFLCKVIAWLMVRQAAQMIGLENYEWWVLLSFEQPELVI